MSYIICWFLFNSKMLADSKMPCSNTQKFSAIPSRSLCSQEMSIPEVVFVSKVPPPAVLPSQTVERPQRHTASDSCSWATLTPRHQRSAERPQRRPVSILCTWSMSTPHSQRSAELPQRHTASPLCTWAMSTPHSQRFATRLQCHPSSILCTWAMSSQRFAELLQRHPASILCTWAMSTPSTFRTGSCPNGVLGFISFLENNYF